MTPREVVEAYQTAIQAGDNQRAFALYAEDVVMRISGRSAFAGDRHGLLGISEYAGAVMKLAGGNVDMELVDALSGDGERVALLTRERLRRGGTEVVLHRANVYTVRDSLITEIDIFEHDQYAIDAFLAS